MLALSRILPKLAVALALGASVLLPQQLLRGRESPLLTIVAPPSATERVELATPLAIEPRPERVARRRERAPSAQPPSGASAAPAVAAAQPSAPEPPCRRSRSARRRRRRRHDPSPRPTVPPSATPPPVTPASVPPPGAPAPRYRTRPASRRPLPRRHRRRSSCARRNPPRIFLRSLYRLLRLWKRTTRTRDSQTGGSVQATSARATAIVTMATTAADAGIKRRLRDVARFRLRFALYVAAFLLPLGAATFAFARYAADGVRERADTRLNTGLRTAVTRYASELETANRRAEALAESEPVRRALAEPDRPELRRLARMNPGLAFYAGDELLAGRVAQPSAQRSVAVFAGPRQLGRIVTSVALDGTLVERIEREVRLPGRRSGARKGRPCPRVVERCGANDRAAGSARRGRPARRRRVPRRLGDPGTAVRRTPGWPSSPHATRSPSRAAP